MTAEEVLAGLDFAPSMCWMRACTQEATVVARPACGCWTWPLCDDHDGLISPMLGPDTHAYCRTCHRTSPLTLEALSAPGDGQTPPPPPAIGVGHAHAAEAYLTRERSPV
jgi:hypothetical protein